MDEEYEEEYEETYEDEYEETYEEEYEEEAAIGKFTVICLLASLYWFRILLIYLKSSVNSFNIICSNSLLIIYFCSLFEYFEVKDKWSIEKISFKSDFVTWIDNSLIHIFVIKLLILLVFNATRKTIVIL